MDALELLKKDHDELREFFRQFEEAGKRAKKKRQTIAEETMKELKAHSELEERIFYPAVQKKGGAEAKDLVLEGLEEHQLAKYLMERLQQAGPEDKTFDAKYKVLSESVMHHLEEEESQLFPEAKKSLAKDLERLGNEMEQLEKQLEGEGG